MMQPIVFYVDMFANNSEADMESSRLKLLFLLEALTWCSLEYLKTHPDTPSVYDAKGPNGSGIVYQPEFGTEEWQDIPTTLRRGFGDCEDLASYQCAWLRFHGIPAKPHIKWRMIDGSWRFHALLQHPDEVTVDRRGNRVVIPGRIEDPSLRLGMRKWQSVLSAKLPGEF